MEMEYDAANRQLWEIEVRPGDEAAIQRLFIISNREMTNTNDGNLTLTTTDRSRYNFDDIEDIDRYQDWLLEDPQTGYEMWMEELEQEEERALHNLADEYLALTEDIFNHSSTLEHTAEEIDEQEVIRSEMQEVRQREMEPYLARVEEMAVAYLGGADSELDYDTTTSPSASEVDEAEEIQMSMREEGRRVNWEQATSYARDDDWGRALLAQIRNNNRRYDDSNSGSI